MWYSSKKNTENGIVLYTIWAYSVNWIAEAYLYVESAFLFNLYELFSCIV